MAVAGDEHLLSVAQVLCHRLLAQYRLRSTRCRRDGPLRVALVPRAYRDDVQPLGVEHPRGVRVVLGVVVLVLPEPGVVVRHCLRAQVGKGRNLEPAAGQVACHVTARHPAASNHTDLQFAAHGISPHASAYCNHVHVSVDLQPLPVCGYGGSAQPSCQRQAAQVRQ